MTLSLSEHRLALAKELLEDIEYSRLPVDALLLKARRLARVMEDDAIEEWLKFELNGYTNSEIAGRYMQASGRWTDASTKTGYYQPLSGIEGAIQAMTTEMSQLRVPDYHYAPSSANPKEFVGDFGASGGAANAATQVMFRLITLTTNITTLKGIRSRALAMLQSFVADTYYELEFSSVAESVFDKHKIEIDAMLAHNAGDAMTKVPAIYDRLMNGEPEAISQALSSCRRMIKAFVDSVCPPKEAPADAESEEYAIGSDQVLNRIRLYLEKCPSRSRRARLNRTMRDIYKRESAGTHGDVTADEARSLFLATYLALGEILLATNESLHGRARSSTVSGLNGHAGVADERVVGPGNLAGN